MKLISILLFLCGVAYTALMIGFPRLITPMDYVLVSAIFIVAVVFRRVKI